MKYSVTISAVGQETKERLPKTTEETLQAVDAEGNPLCLYCSNKVKKGLKAGAWEARFCSHNCHEEYLVSFELFQRFFSWFTIVQP